jgi:hypothetical protein
LEAATACLIDPKRFLDLCYSADYGRERLEAWLTYGPPRLHHAPAALRGVRLPAHHSREATLRDLSWP